jgi:hypothetical protein
MPRYKNTAKTRVLGYEPGEEFDIDLDEVQERRLLEGGHIDYVHEAPVSLGPTEDAAECVCGKESTKGCPGCTGAEADQLPF